MTKRIDAEIVAFRVKRGRVLAPVKFISFTRLIAARAGKRLLQ